MRQRQTIAVGVSGVDSWRTLAWAVAEATIVGGRVVVCHVCPPDSVLAAPRAYLSLAALGLADPGLSRAVAAARHRLGEERVDLRICLGKPGEALVDAATDADLMVVGAPRRPGWAERASTTHHVVRHAACPVVVVRPGSDARRGPFAGHVVVGVDGSEPSRAAVELGFAYAFAHRRPLAAVHVAAQPPEGYWFDEDRLETHHVDQPAGSVLLAEQVKSWRHDYPTVAVKRALYVGRPLPGLLRAADGAKLLVVGDRGRGRAVRALLGSVSHGAVDHAVCPVAIAHPTHARIPVPS
jgi:nucleotide-binding universal stress UspA family protein